MAEEQLQESQDIIDHHRDDLREEKIQTHDSYTPEDLTLDGKQPHSEALSSIPANREAKSDEDVEPIVEDDGDLLAMKIEGDVANQKMVLFTDHTSPREDSEPNIKDISREVNDKGHGDCVRESETLEEPAVKADTSSGDQAKGNKELGTVVSQVVDDSKDDQIDGPTAWPEEESTTANITDTEAREEAEEEEEKDPQNNTSSPQTPPLQGTSLVEDLDISHVETICPTTTEATEPEVPGTTGRAKYYLAVVVVVLIAIMVPYFQQKPPTQKNDLQQIDIFLKELEKIKTQFPNQRADLWNRSKIHLKRHLLTAQPTEPVSLILTSGLRAERTLHCLAQSLASAFSSALNASVLHIDGASTASQDSDQVKLDIDSKLQGAFEGDKPVAVIHRFEELPPGSTLIFYRYCDHENAAYKKTFLIFTVLLGEEDEIPEKIHLSAVEEMVDDHLQKKFLSHDYPVSFDRMDLDKYGGLWSRISHLILPVAAEERIEREGC